MHELVKIPEQGNFKYVVIGLESGECILRGNFLNYHEDIVRQVEAEEGITGEVLGGGLIIIRANILMVVGESMKYGPVSKIVVKKLLKSWAKELGLELIISRGVE